MHCKVISLTVVWPSPSSIPVVNLRDIPHHLRSASAQIGKTSHPIDPEVGLFIETVSIARGRWWWRRCCGCWDIAIEEELGSWDSHLSIVRVRTPISNLDALPTAPLEHFHPERVCPSCNCPASAGPPPSMKTIIVYHKVVVKPQLAAVIRVCREEVRTGRVYQQVSRPAHCIIISFLVVRPIITCISVIGLGGPSHEGWSSVAQ